MTNSHNSFAAYQTQKQAGRVGLIEKILAGLEDMQVSFPHVTALAALVATQVAIEEHRACHKATLLRNSKYRTLLKKFMSQEEPGLQNFDLRNLADNKALAVVTVSKLEVANLRRENERLKLYIASLEHSGKTAKDAREVKSNESGDASQSALETLQIKYATVCQALHAMLKYMESMVAADADAEQFIDLSKLRNNVIVERRLAAPFFEWVRANKGIL